MKIVIVTDAWTPQVNGVVTTLVDLRARLGSAGHEIVVIEPSGFRRVRCPGYGEIELAWGASREVRRLLSESAADAIHIATEGPLGFAARSHCRAAGIPFSTAFHSRFPDFLHAATGIPARWGYAVMRRFHAPSSGVMVPSRGTYELLASHGFANLKRWSLAAWTPSMGATRSIALPPSTWCPTSMSGSNWWRTLPEASTPSSARSTTSSPTARVS